MKSLHEAWNDGASLGCVIEGVRQKLEMIFAVHFHHTKQVKGTARDLSIGRAPGMDTYIRYWGGCNECCWAMLVTFVSFTSHAYPLVRSMPLVCFPLITTEQMQARRACRSVGPVAHN